MFLEVIKKESAATRELTGKQFSDQVAKAKESGVKFITLPAAQVAELQKLAEPAIDKWGAEDRSGIS